MRELSSSQTHAIVPPIFVFDPPDVIAFATLEAAETYLEPVDIENGVYVGAYDAAGRKLAFRIETTPSWGGKLLGHRRVRVDCVEDDPSHQNELRSLLLQHLGEQASMDGFDLHALVQAVTRRVGLTK